MISMRIYLTILFAGDIIRNVIGFVRDVENYEPAGVILSNVFLICVYCFAIICVWAI